MNLLYSVLVYGKSYADVFLSCVLSSALDETNLPAIKDRLAVELYTDAETLEMMKAHPNFQRLASLVKLSIKLITTPTFDERYDLQALTQRNALKRGAEEKMAVAYTCADAYFGQGFFPALLKRLDEGHDAVCGMAIRIAAEPLVPIFAQVSTFDTPTLFDLCRRTLHPLWTHAHWKNPLFTRLQYSILWSDDEEIVLRTSSLNPCAIVPTEEMLESMGYALPDQMGLSCYKNPYVEEEWSDLPLVELCPLKHLYPPYSLKPASPESYAEWHREAGLPDGLRNMERYTFRFRTEKKESPLVAESDAVVESLIRAAR